MSKRKILFLVSAMLVGALVIANLALAQDPGMPHMEREKGRPMGLPDLTTEQLTKLQRIELEHQKAILPLRAQLQTKQLELYTLIIEDTDWEKINAKIEEIGKIHTDLQKKQVSQRVAIRKLLTDEQKIHFDAREIRCGGSSDIKGCRGHK
ncbi:MAG: periplasmic heavy metal sensor [Candidatus Stahlbacteria bacterium]|nr:periplasmic heavy metal sensor [Candidatus Stahlbacteria bacterium]